MHKHATTPMPDASAPASGSDDASPAPWIRVRDLTVRAGAKTLLDQVSFTLRPGELVALVGANGAGKSTLIKSLAGLVDAFDGSIDIDGRPLRAYPPRALARRIAYVPQASTGRAPPFTVEEYVRLARYAHDDAPGRTPPHDANGEDSDPSVRAKNAVDDALGRTGMTALRDRLWTTLSGGERQMASMAAALAQDADGLLLDEPAAFLDMGHQEAVLSLLVRWHGERRRAVVLVTHDVNAAIHASHRTLGLRGGRLVYDGPSGALSSGDALTAIYGTAFAWVDHPVSGQRTVASVGADAARWLSRPPSFSSDTPS